MRIDSFHVDGFGPLQDTGLARLSPHMSVFCGPNESGKSTLVGFLRFLLFGLPDKRAKANRYPARQAGPGYGGRLTLATSLGRYCLSRHEALELLLPSGVQGNEENLRELLGGITQETFSNVFAFSLSELQRLDDAFGQGEVHEELHRAAAGFNPRLVDEAEGFLQGEMAGLFEPSGGRAAVNAALSELATVRDEIRDSEDKLAAFDKLSGEISTLESSLQNYQEQERELRAELDSLKDLLSLLERRHKRRGDLDVSGGECESLRRARSDIHLDAPLLRFSGEIRDLLRERSQLVAFGKEKPGLERQLEDTRRGLAVSTSQLGPDWTVERIESFHIPAGDLAGLGAKEHALRQVEIEVAEARVAERKAMDDHDAAVARDNHAAKRFEELAPVPPKLDAALFERLQLGVGDYERAASDFRAREAELRDAEAELSRSLGEIDPRWTEKELRGFDASLPARQRLQSFREKLVLAGSTLERAGQDVHRAEEERRKAAARHAAVKQKQDFVLCPPYATPTALKDFRSSRDQLYLKWVRKSVPLMPSWLPIVVAVLGSTTALAWSFLSPLLGTGALVAVAVLLVSIRLWEHRQPKAVGNVAAEFADLCRKLSLKLPLSRESFDEISRLLDTAGEAAAQRQFLADQLQAAAKLLSEAEQDLAGRQQILRVAETALEEETANWRGHLAEIGLAPTLSPEEATAAAFRIDVCRERLEKVQGLQRHKEVLEQNRREYLEVLNQLLAARGQAPASDTDAPVRLNEFFEAVRKENEARSRREEVRSLWMRASEERRREEETIAKAAHAHQRALGQQQRLNEERRQWLEKHSLPPHMPPGAAEDFLRLMDQARDALNRTRELESKLRAITDRELNIGGRLSDLLVSTGRASSGNSLSGMDALAAELDAAEKHVQEAATLDARIEEMDARAKAIRTELEEMDASVSRLRAAVPREDLDVRWGEIARALTETRAQMEASQNRLAESRSRRQALAADDRLSRLQERRESLEEQIRQAARKWAVQALALRLFGVARKRFEEKRQPAVVRRASPHFRRLTADRYRAVRMPVDGGELNVLPADGPPKTTEQLSRATAEQLYLALRFGFIEEFMGTRDPLPLVMDDILVNFDPARASAAMESIVQLSEHFQIFYFTCHPSTAARFREIDRSITVFELANGRINVSGARADAVSV